MKKYIRLLAGLTVIFSLLSFLWLPKQNIPNQKTIYTLVYESLINYHYEHLDFNDSISAKIYDEYLNAIDPNRLFFLQSDIKKFEKHKYKLDDYLQQNNLYFFDLVNETYKNRIAEVRNYYKKILQKPFNFEKKEYLSSEKDLPFPKNKKELEDNWRKNLKYQVLIKLVSELQQQEKAKEKNDTTFEYKTFEEMEAQAREEVRKTYDDYFERLDKLTDDDRFSVFMNSITAAVDPHTNYMAPKMKEDFDIYMSGELEGIGATLQQKDGKIKIISLVPGGPAWKQGDLEVGDFILKVAQGDDGQWVNVVGMRLDDAVRLIRGKKGSKVRLTIEKKDGTIKEISIIRDKIIIEETYAKSIILQDSLRKHKVGYIYIPSFYADFKKKGRRVKDDFLKELQKLKSQNIDGIIIDLRNNGGGSLEDVIEMVGYFIKNGPVVQVRNRKHNVDIRKDKNDNIYYTGNLLVMTNYFSASASEIFAAAIQDWHRGLVFGAFPHTHGKGTVQSFINFDQIFRGKKLGALKLTIAKFYRINGSSTQLKGVKPDIPFVDVFSYIKTGEKELDNPLPWDTIESATYKPLSYHFNIDSVKKRSLQRMKRDSFFIYTKKYAEFMKKDLEDKKIPLNLEEYRDYLKTKKTYTKPYNKFKNKKTNIILTYTISDSLKMQTDTIMKMRYEKWTKKLSKDHQLYEAYNIIEDMKKFERKN